MKLILLMLTFSISAFAHFDFGKYTGVDSSGKDCSITFLKKEYSEGIKNPLNEKVFINAFIKGKAFTQQLVHPMKFDKQTKTIGFDHDHLQNYYGTQSGAVLFKVSVHEGSGPDHFHVFSTNWKTQKNSSLDCMQLRKTVK